MQAIFFDDLRHADEVHLDTFRTRSLLARMQEQLARRIAPFIRVWRSLRERAARCEILPRLLKYSARAVAAHRRLRRNAPTSVAASPVQPLGRGMQRA
jgi:hypothetical protein